MSKKKVINEQNNILIKSTYKNAHISPSKVRLTANAVRRNDVKSAINKLTFYNNKASKVLKKTLLSAVANADQKGYKIANLYINDIKLGKGMTLKRFRYGSHGHIHPILKRWSNITIELGVLNNNIVKKNKEENNE